MGEVTALMNTAVGPRYKATLSLAFYCGLRRGEICFLQWEDIDFENLQLAITDRESKHTKTRLSRTIALRQETADILIELARLRENEWVFTDPQKFYNHCDPWFRRLVKQAQIDHCNLHDLRKTCNTLMKDAGIGQETAMQILGHKTAQVNQLHYTGVLTDQQRLAVNTLPSVG